MTWQLHADPTARYRDLGPEFFDNRVRPERRKLNHIRYIFVEKPVPRALQRSFQSPEIADAIVHHEGRRRAEILRILGEDRPDGLLARGAGYQRAVSLTRRDGQPQVLSVPRRQCGGFLRGDQGGHNHRASKAHRN